MKNGCDLNVTDNQKRNLIHYIAINGTAEMLQTVTEYLKYISCLQGAVSQNSSKRPSLNNIQTKSEMTSSKSILNNSPGSLLQAFTQFVSNYKASSE